MQPFNIPTNLLRTVVFAAGLLFLWQSSTADPISDRILARRMALQAEEVEHKGVSGPASLPAGARLLRDVAYGTDGKQRMDVYLPAQAAGAPVIFMVHGGAWSLGDKGAQAVVENKVAHWIAKGFIFISSNYRLLPEAAPVEQGQDVAKALATAQARAAAWGGDPAKFIVMGHSAGAHLAALLAASPAAAWKSGARPWLGTVLLDSAALDVVQIMQAKHARFYDRAFGDDPAYWRKASPLHVLSAAANPILAVCSTRRDDSCPQAHQFVDKAKSMQVRARVLEMDLSHQEINQQLGSKGDYTDAVDSFLGTLDESVKQALRD